MAPRFEIRRKQLLKEAEIKPQVYEGMLERLPSFLNPYLECVGRRENREHLQRYLQGLISDVERKNVETIAYLHDQGRRELANGEIDRHRMHGQAASAPIADLPADLLQHPVPDVHDQADVLGDGNEP